MMMEAPMESSSNYTLENIEVVVEMCAQSDCDNELTWQTAKPVNGKAGQYKATDLGLAGNHSDSIKVRLSVNNEIKTTSGLETGTSYATFDFSGSSDTSDMMH
jgi:hypothetical protein